jgi:predicted glycosyltransferase involved in capsule biosynthesis
MNRFHHLKRTFHHNLANIIRFGNEVEWVIVNYNSRDRMDEELRAYRSFTAGGNLQYYRTTDFAYFNYSHSKNLAHILAGGDYVVNLDADNLLERDGVSKILRAFSERPDAVLQGYGGLIGLKKSHFLSLGGYDEDFKGWGHEDNDLIRRAKSFGLEHFQLDCLKGRIEHDDEERLSNFDPVLIEGFEAKDPVGIKMEMNERNGIMSTARFLDGKISANQGRMFGRAAVTKNFSDELFEVGCMGREDATAESTSAQTR